MATRPASADVIPIDPNSYPNFPATDISSAFAGVTLSTNSGGAVYVANWKTNSDDNVLAGEFGISFSLNWRLSGDGVPAFRADFDRPTDSVSMLTDPSTGLNYSRLRAFNLAGELIQSISAAHVFATATLIDGGYRLYSGRQQQRSHHHRSPDLPVQQNDPRTGSPGILRVRSRRDRIYTAQTIELSSSGLRHFMIPSTSGWSPRNDRQRRRRLAPADIRSAAGRGRVLVRLCARCGQ